MFKNSKQGGVAEAPVIDAREARWASEAVANLARQLPSDSIVALVLEQAQQELGSLAASSVNGSRVVGPFRIRAAA